MNSKNHKDFFWPSYVDVMTNLFAVTLVLFVVSFFLFRKKTKDLEVMKQEYIRIQEMNQAIRQLDSNSFFRYNEEYKKHILTLQPEYKINEFEIPEGLNNPGIVSDIRDAGISIIKTILDLKKEYVEADSTRKAIDVKFLIVIEGQASKNGEEEYNDILSFRRALSLKKFWIDPKNHVEINGYTLTDPEMQCEVIVSGSGFYGSPRVKPEFINGRANPANQRFLVHLVPVIDWN